MDSYLGYVTAYRVWRVCAVNNCYYLRSLSVPELWIPFTPLKAVCNINNNTYFSEPHSIKHDCGIYAYKNEDFIRLNSTSFGGVVVGKVSLWGYVIEHEMGYRAEYAYPSELLYFICMECYKIITSEKALLLRSATIFSSLESSPVCYYSRCQICKTLSSFSTYLGWQHPSAKTIESHSIFEGLKKEYGI